MIAMRWLFLLVLLSIPTQANAQDCLQMELETRDKVRAILLEALDEALKDHIKHLFLVWRSGDASAGQGRARQGTREGVKAYVRARETILRMEWACPLKP
jgi:hypothetical protein